jgi:hypothetical protein
MTAKSKESTMGMERTARQFLACALAMSGTLLVGRIPVRAAVPEPDAVFYGTVYVNGILARNGVVVSAKLGTATLTSYTVGDDLAVGSGSYLLRIHVAQPTSAGDTAPSGSALEGDTATLRVGTAGIPYAITLNGGTVQRRDLNSSGPPTPTPTSTPVVIGCCQIPSSSRAARCANVSTVSACTGLGGTFRTGYGCGVTGFCLPPNTPTRTPSRTRTVPANTSTRTPSRTRTVPATRTATRSYTPTPTPSATATPRLASSPTRTARPTATPLPSCCQFPGPRCTSPSSMLTCTGSGGTYYTGRTCHPSTGMCMFY